VRRQIALGIFATFFVCAAARAAENYQFWIGGRHENSGQSWYPCGTKAQVAAQNICTVQLPGNRALAFDYTLDRGASNAGGQCCYTQFRVSCYNMPRIASNRQRTIRIGERDSDAGCVSDPVHIARSFCAIHGPGATQFPFTVTRTSTSGGHRCGHSTYEIKCREPFPASNDPAI